MNDKLEKLKLKIESYVVDYFPNSLADGALPFSCPHCDAPFRAPAIFFNCVLGDLQVTRCSGCINNLIELTLESILKGYYLLKCDLVEEKLGQRIKESFENRRKI
jgi:hypothetical protein